MIIESIQHLLDNRFGLTRDHLNQCITSFIREALKGLKEPSLGLVVVLSSPKLYPGTPYLGYCLKVIDSPPESCTVLGKIAPARADPNVKSTAWIEERKRYTDLIKGTAVNEVILVQDDGSILEGLSSNFAVITKDGSLHTAPDDLVLPGTIMKIVKEACEKLGIPIDLATPKLPENQEWQAAFITSTSRLVLPVTDIKTDSGTIHISSTASDILQRIQEEVQAILEKK